MTYDIHYASGANAEDTGLPPQLIAGDTPALATQDFLIVVSTNPIKQFTPLKNNSGALVPWTAGSEVAAIAAFDLPVGTARKAVYVAGMFNIDAINWPTGTTEAQVEAAQITGGMIRFRKLLHSDKRTGNESQYVGPGNEAGGQPLTFTGGALPAGAESAAYSYDLDLRVHGGVGARTFALESGTLPTGLSLNASTGVISGTAGSTTGGNYSPVFSVTDEEGNEEQASCTLAIADV